MAQQKAEGQDFESPSAPELAPALKEKCIIGEETADPTVKEKIISRLHEVMAPIAVFCDMCQQVNKETESTLSAALFKIHSLFGVVKKELILKDVAESIANLPEIIQALGLFVTRTFEMLGNQGLSQKMVGCLLCVESWFMDCTQESDLFCDRLSQNGMILHFFYQLGELRKNTTCIEAVHELMVNTIGILNSFAMRNKYHNQFFDLDYYKTLTPYIYSPLEELRFSSLFTLSYLIEIIPKELFHLLAIEQAELKTIVQELNLSVATDEIHLSGFVFSTVEILSLLKNLTMMPENGSLMISCGILGTLIELVKSTIADIRLHSLVLLLNLPHLGNEDTFKAILSHLMESPLSMDENQVKAAIEFKIHSNTDLSKGINAIKACYQQREYEKCAKIFEIIEPMLATSDSNLQETKTAKLLHAKALFHLYKKCQRSLNKFSTDLKQYRLRHKNCYLKAKEVILKLGIAWDEKYLDMEGSKFLDLSMIDYLSETNNLKSCKRCVLCHTKAPLKRSHLWPESLLQLYMSGVDSPASHKLFYKISEDGVLSTFSPHQFSYWMFCQECEQRLSKNGETQCIPLIKSHIYDISDPMSPSRHLHIRYKEWLYYFCIGLIFRGLVSPDPHVSITAFTNEDEIYELLTLCRKAILDLEEIPKKFQVALQFTPTCLQKDDKHSGFINSLLTSFGLFALSDARLSDGSVCKPREAQFFLAHCGVINIIVPLGRSREISLPQDCIITPKKGTYSIPSDEDRLALLPPGIMTFFRLLADCSEVNFLVKPQKLETHSWIEPSSEKELVIGHNTALDEDIEQTGGVIRSSWLGSNPKTLSFLPHAFQILRPFHRPCSVIVPSGHKILLHHTFTTDESCISTVFLATGSDKVYSNKDPYIIYHRYDKQGVQINSGFFISPETLSPTSFLPDDLDKCLTSYFNAKEADELGGEIKKMLQKSGFESIYSVLLHSERNKNRVFDTNCQPRKCWYCKDLCEVCMQECCTVGCEIVDHDSDSFIRHTFCKLCWKEYQISKVESADEVSWPKLVPLIPQSEAGSDELFSSHRTILSVKCSFDIFNHFFLSLCIGDASGPYSHPYALTQTRSLAHQDCAESFISQDYSPIKPLPYCSNCKGMQEKIDYLNNEGLMQSILNHVLLSEDTKETLTLLKSCFSESTLTTHEAVPNIH